MQRPKQRVRPTADQSIRSAHTTAMQPRNIHFSTRARRVADTLLFTDGMTGREIAIGALIGAAFAALTVFGLWAGYCFTESLAGWY